MLDDENDIKIETSDDEGGESTLGDKLKQLREKLRACEQEKAANLLGWQRAKADFINVSKRADDERHLARASGIEDFIENLLPVLDSLEAAMQTVPSDAPWAKGFANVETLLKKTLDSYQVSVIDAIGVAEDPRIHESIQTTPASPTQKTHTVTSILQKGYKVGDKVIRAAKVVVAI